MSKPKPLFVEFSARWANYAGMAFGVALLNLITIGIYKPYGLTRIRRALYRQIFVGKDTLDYSGDASSLSRSTFYPSLALLSLLLGPGILQFYVSMELAAAIGVVQMLLLVAFSQYLVFCQKTYELGQISWRGLSFSLDGSALRYMGQSCLAQFLKLISLGFYAPFARIKLDRQIYDQLHFGRHKVACTISPRPLLPLYIIGWIATLAGLAGAGYYYWINGLQPALIVINGGEADPAMASQVDPSTFSGGDMGGIGGGAPDPQSMAQLGTLLHALFLAFSVYPLWVSWRQICLAPYEIAYWRHLAENLKAGPYRLRFEGGILRLILLNVISFQLNFFTANLSRPFTTFAKIRYFCSSTLVLEDIHNEANPG